jgi:hypothetical protein
LIRIESRTFIVGFRHGSLSYGLARSDGSDRFIELYHAVAIAEAAGARANGLGPARRGPHTVARRWRLTLVLRYKPPGAAP